jgi:DnaJ-class molecular chaperone
VRAYDILTDAEQRATYDQLLAIALQPPAASTAVRTYEVIGKVASNTMAATVISAVLVGGYVLFGCFQNHPAQRKSSPRAPSAKRNSSQRYTLTSPLRMSRAINARATHRPSAPS